MNIVRVVCANPRCQKVLRIRASQGGKRIRCPACRSALIAPHVPGASMAAPLDDQDAEDAALDAPRSAWTNLLFYLGILAGVFGMVVLAIAFEVWLVLDNWVADKGETAVLLRSGPWKIPVPKDGKDKQKAREETAEPWFNPGMVWTFHQNGRAESGPLMENYNRYNREPAKGLGFRTWKWIVTGDKVTLTSVEKSGHSSEKVTFKVADLGDDKTKKVTWVVPSATEEAPERTITLEKVPAVETFPDWRVVFYAGVLAPLVVTCLLSWLISREVFSSGCLRFALAWPLTVLIGLALGAGAGFLMDMLNDHSHGVMPYWMLLMFGQAMLPYWMLLSFTQGILCLLMGFWLAAALSCLRPT